MNPFLNPKMMFKFVNSYYFHPNRIKRLSPKKIEKLQNKKLKRILSYANTIPVYRNKFKKAGINLSDIHGIKDIVKLPYISKKDIMDNFPDNIIPHNFDKSKAQIISTSGSTGKPISFYTDFDTMIDTMGATLRILDSFNLNWKKSKWAHIGNYSPGKADSAAENLFFENARAFRSLNNYLPMNAFDPIPEIIEKLNNFQPEMIISYPQTFQQLAIHKKHGKAEKLNPKVLASGGYILDDYTKTYVEEAFKCKMLNVYASAESEADVAFQCFEGTWHINYDFFYIEAIDDNLEVVGPEERGHVLMTRLFGKGTPFIRYTGMDDWVTIVPEYECDCGLCTPIFKNGVEGRLGSSVILPDGRVFPSASFAILSVVLNELNTRKVSQFQIIQKKIDEIDILLVIDEQLRDKDPRNDILFKKIKEVYEKKVGPDVKINIKEVKEIKTAPGKPMPLVISNVKPEEGFRIVDK